MRRLSAFLVPLILLAMSSVEMSAQATTVRTRVFYQGSWNGLTQTPVPVSVELRSASSTPNSSVLYQRATAMLQTNGFAEVTFDTLTSGNYWIVVRSGGALSIASSSVQNITAGSTFTYSFTGSQSDTFNGVAHTVVNGGVVLVRSGDFDANGIINNTSDAARVLPNNGRSTSVPRLPEN